MKWNKTLAIHQEILYIHMKKPEYTLKIFEDIWKEAKDLSFQEILYQYSPRTWKNLITFNLNFIIIDTFTKNHHKDVSQDDKIHKIIYHTRKIQVKFL